MRMTGLACVDGAPVVSVVFDSAEFNTQGENYGFVRAKANATRSSYVEGHYYWFKITDLIEVA